MLDTISGYYNNNQKKKTLSDKFSVKGRDQDYTLFVMGLGLLYPTNLLNLLPN